MEFDTEVLIVGGGLAGLALARALTQADVSFRLIEGRDRFGGRIKTLTHDGARFDLGPSWFWPGQPRMAALTKALGVTVFEQFSTGHHIYEDQSGALFQQSGPGAMKGTFRVGGGMTSLIDAVVSELPQAALSLGQRCVALDQSKGAQIQNGDWINARHVVLATPPRLALDLPVAPDWEGSVRSALTDTPTWMAGQAKFVALYPTPFWRGAGFSGDAQSHIGPMVEIHDASDAQGPLGALFGFIGVPATTRKGRAAQVTQAALDQLVRLFGAQAAHPVAYALRDWAEAPLTACDLDKAPLAYHPAYGLPPALHNLWGGRLHFGATETAADFGGFLEGALARAEELALLIQRTG